jgi:toxin CcdB
VIRQFSVFENPSPRSRGAVPFVVLMQSHFVDAMHTALIAPVVREPSTGDFSRVSVEVVVDGETLHVSLAEMAPVLRSALKNPVGSLLAHEDDIRRALDRLFTGF